MDRPIIPVGTSNFAEIRREGYYFIDRSDLIRELLETKGTKVTLITRPRRFGKTLAMRMLADFFDIQKDSRDLFTGLSIMDDTKLCEKWMNQYPTLFLSFKNVDGLNFTSAYAQLASVIAELYKKHFYLLDDDRINVLDKEIFYKIAAERASLTDIKNSLLKLTQSMEIYYGKPVILLIDEYDVPLAKANEKGYYPEMLDAIKGVMQAIKDNDPLRSAIITGCLQIAKESIFTGTNNFVSDTIADNRLSRYFGFTQAEVDQLLIDTGMAGHTAEIKEWYNGYCFGKTDVYCPWDVMNHVQNLLLDPDSPPEDFWKNTSDNAVIRNFLDRTDLDINDKFETLLAGGHIIEPVEEDLTYDMLRSSEKNLWSLLYMTGYLTKMHPPANPYALKIPNREILGLFKNSVKTWFTEKSAEKDRSSLFAALWNGDAQRLSTLISDLLFDTISYFDYEESFYHAFITALFLNAGYRVESDYENGLGRSDIVIKDRKDRRAAVIEAKRTDTGNDMEKICAEALQQISDKQYARKVERDGFKKVLRFGIAFFKKTCLVRSQ